MNDAPDTSRLLERFGLIVNGPALFNALVAGIELGVFDTLAEGPAPFEAVRARTQLPTHQLRVLMHALCATELVDKEDGRYSNTAVAAELLTGDGPDSWKHILRGWQDIYYPAFPHATTALRAGTNTALAGYPGDEPTLYQRLSHVPEREAVLHASMSAFTLQSMSGLLDHIGLAPGERLLDIGGGDGTTARELLARFPGNTVTIFDLPSVVALAEESEGTAADGRITYQGGDLFEDDFPGGVDAVLFSHCLEVLSPERILVLLRKAHAALRPGGRLFIYGFTLNDQERGVYSARLSLYLTVLATGQGLAYPVEEYERLMREAGFPSVEAITGLPYEHSLMVATKA
ncbi:methyltransferase [Streptomyces albireticuli]|uniref:methyltransferase n=1 Tax=Streptomyces albireticuli TaxID=1940 RepID=UPI0036A213E6